ncbi:hypothetical protein JX265_010928 [Neoarthrinium moseri]|uniref:Uncharacterized protein n=1 Tax=Neoarthrinium moseri TaxID=1658444 RepID=A0A9P9WDL1_9PEZI|nr:uncharacterized protein JN550_008960 [Neoarthrinium moseri]KAI1846343.1 hypothetical protein JX266_007548 [Neoarthrinium moseri]KAI1858260.1 hypothetical protein JX265_010928 [Neoarthrinium moseri]KAI1864403.1 hypothetical protein JN550_008960 [Neoarthrinium moseri]
MKVLRLLVFAFGTIHCFPHLEPLIRDHIERRVLDKHRRADPTATNSGSTSTGTADASLPTAAVTIRDTTGLLQLNPGTDGNLFISLVADVPSITSLIPGTSEFFAYPDTMTIMGDNSDTSRLLYYYPDEMSTLSVSRLRLAAWGSIPIGAMLASFVPFDDGNGNNVLVVLDTTGNYFWPVLCGFDGALNKVFIAQDYEQGPDILLENGDLRYILSGGDATDCGLLALMAQGLDGGFS